MRLAVFDVGGTAIKYSVMEGEGAPDQFSQHGEVPTPNGLTETQEAFLVTLEGVLEQMGPVEGIAFSLPGVIDVDRKYLHTGGALMYNYDVDVNEWERRFGLPVEIENDARCSTMAELSVGNLQGVTNGAVLTFGTGIGGGAVVNGEVFKGSHLYAGEASLMYYRMPDKDSAVREEGSFSTDCSTFGLCRRVAEAKGVESCNGREVFAWIEAGDEAACRVFHDVCDGIAVQVHNIQCWLDPERICLGGGVSKNPLFIEGVRDALDRFNKELRCPFPTVEVMPCRFFNDANLIGACQHFLRMQRRRAESR